MRIYISLLFLALISCAGRSDVTTRMNFEINKNYKIENVEDPDRSEIIKIINQTTNEAIISIQKQENGTLEVKTGVIKGRLSGAGQIFILKLTEGHWTLFNDGKSRSWVS